MIKQLQKQVLRYLAFIVGTGQLVLSEENKAYWMFIQTIGDLQTLSLLFVMNLSYHVQNFNILKYITLPTTVLMESLDDHVVALTILMFVISIMHLVNILLIVQQSSNYQRQKESRRNLASDSMQSKFEKLTKIYGYSDYMNIWFQLNIKSKSSTLHLTKIVVHWFHVYNILINKPVALYAFYVIVYGQTAIESTLAAILLGFNVINFIICYNVQLIALTVNGSNFLRLQCSYIYSFGQFVEHIIIVWVVIDVNQAIVPIVLLALVFTLNIAEFFYSMPFIEDYKRVLTITTNCTCFVIALTELNFNLGAQIQLTFIIVPFLVRILHYIAYYSLYYLITKYLIPEKLLTDLTADSNITNTKGVNETYIKSIMHKVKIYAIGQLQHYSFTYFPQLLRLVNISRLRDNQILMINPEVPQQLSPIVSKLLFHAGLLFQQHSSNCQSIYCYCRGFKGETLKGSQGSVNIHKMFSNQDLEISSINIYADLIHRYIRNYCKSVFRKYQTKQDLIYLIQLVSYQADSEENIQSIVTIMDLISKITTKKKKLSWYEQIAIGIATQFVQFSIVVKQNNAITPPQMDTTFKYEFFRAVYKKSLKIFRKLADCIKAKQVYFTNLNYQQSYESMEDLIKQLNVVNKSTLEALQKFMLRTQSKTALLCSLVFEFEIRNNYNNADKIVQQLKGRESDFFEYPDIHYEVEENSVEICFMRVDLGCAALKDQYNGTKRGWIRDFSRSTPNFFKYNDSEFKKLRNIVQLMPYSTQRIHDNFIDLFLLTSRPAVIRAHIPVWAKSKYDELIVTEFFIDFDFKFPNGQLTIYVFLKKIKNTTSAGRLKQYFWVDSEGNLEAVSQNVPSTFKINDPDKQWLYNQAFSTLMPEFAEVQIELNQQLELFLKNEEQSKGKISESNSRTMESLQIVHSKFLKNASLQFPKELMVGEKDQNYFVDCQIYFKQAYLIGRLYKIYLIEIENYTVDQTDLVRRPKGKQIEQPEIPHEFESEDYRLLDILEERLQVSTPDSSFISEKINSNSAEEVQQVIKFGSNFQFEQQITFNQNNYEKYDKENYLEMRQGGQLATQRQQLYFSDNLLVHNNTINKSVSQTIDKAEIIKENTKARDQLLIMNENQSQSSQATTQGKFKILSKSTLYSQFAESQQVPTSVAMIMALNIFTLFTLLTLITVSLSILDQLNNRFSNETHLLRSTLGSDFVLNVAQYIWEAEVTFMEQTQANIGIIMDQLGQTISHQQIDFFDSIDNTTYPITLWTFFFHLKYYYIQMDDPSEYQETITFFLKNYMSYDDWISTTNGEVYDSIEQSIVVLNTTITICIIVQIIVFMLNTMLLIGCAYQYLQLIKRLIRCCQQISYLSLIFDLEYYDELLAQFTYKQDSNLCYFNLYDHHTDYQDKFRLILKQDVENPKQTDPTQLKHQMAFKMHLLGSKQNLTIKQKLNCKTQMFIPLNLFCSSIFLIAYIASMIDLASFKTSLDQNIKIFSQIVILQEQFLQIILSNSVINDKFDTILNESEQIYYSDLLQTSWKGYHERMSDLLVYDSELTFRFTNKLNDKMCQNSACGFDIAFQNAQTTILKHISESDFNGYEFEQDDIAIISQIQAEFISFLDESEAWLKTNTQSQYDFTLLLLILLGGLMFIIQIIQSIITHQYLNDRFKQVKQFVYQIPTCTLYLEDSFYKTIQYISIKERLLVD